MSYRSTAQIVWGISHTKDTYVSAKSHRLARRLGKPKAIVAVSHTVAVNFYHMITKRLPYQELGANDFDTEDSPTAHQTHLYWLHRISLPKSASPMTLSGPFPLHLSG